MPYLLAGLPANLFGGSEVLARAIRFPCLNRRFHNLPTTRASSFHVNDSILFVLLRIDISQVSFIAVIAPGILDEPISLDFGSPIEIPRSSDHVHLPRELTVGAPPQDTAWRTSKLYR